MRQRNNQILVAFLGMILTILLAVPLQAGDSFSDLFSQTKICFPHIAITDGWETEVAVLNPTAKTVSGSLTFFSKNGTQLGAAFPVTLNPHGRYQVVVGSTFANRGGIEYMIFTAPVFGLKGYTKFYTASTRASIMASSPQTSGLFTKIEHQGFTGIAFVNTSAIDTIVTLTAYSDAGGSPVAVVPLPVKSGEKVVKIATELFYPQSIAGASYISFESKQGIVGFFLNGTGSDKDGNAKLDGSKAL